jgi:hypothetical protein
MGYHATLPIMVNLFKQQPNKVKRIFQRIVLIVVGDSNESHARHTSKKKMASKYVWRNFSTSFFIIMLKVNDDMRSFVHIPIGFLRLKMRSKIEVISYFSSERKKTAAFAKMQKNNLCAMLKTIILTFSIWFGLSHFPSFNLTFLQSSSPLVEALQ